MIVILAGAAAIILGTWLGAPTLAPILVGFVMGLGWPAHAARRAAVAGAVAWGGLLVVGALRGDAIGTLGATLGGAMGVPGWALFAATALYPAVLAASAAWLAHLASPRRGARIDLVAVPRRDQQDT